MWRFDPRRAAIPVLGLLALTIAHASGVEAVDTRGLVAAPFAAERVGTLRDRTLLEVSGMAISRRDPDLIWVHNDSGSRAVLHAIGADGRERARIGVRGATSQDWEDMASFVWRDQPMLMVADVGDNNARRSAVWLHMLVEPDLSIETDGKKPKTDIAWSVPFRFPDGAADCEAVAVDVANERVLVLTKRQNPPRLYELPLAPEGALPGRGKVIEARFLGEVGTIPRPTAADLMADPVFGAWGSQPTAMDMAGDELVILTYVHAYRYLRAPDSTWPQTLAAAPEIVLLPRMKQTEAITFAADGVDLFVTSERRNAPVYRLRRQMPPGTAQTEP